MGFDSNKNVNKIIRASNVSTRSISIVMYLLLSLFNFRHKDVLQVWERWNSIELVYIKNLSLYLHILLCFIYWKRYTSLFDCQTYLDTTLGLAAFYVKRENIVIFFVIRNYPETPHDINTQKVQNQHMWCHIIKIDVIRLLAKYVINLINVLNGFRYICTF